MIECDLSFKVFYIVLLFKSKEDLGGCILKKNTFQVLYKSLGTFIGGQLRNVLTRPELFRWTALVTAGLVLIYYGIYCFLARASDHQIIEEINKKYPRQDQ